MLPTQTYKDFAFSLSVLSFFTICLALLFISLFELIRSSIGTPYEINLDNSILLLEEVNEPPYVIDRLLTQLLLSSKLNKCNAIIIGHMTNCTDDNNYSFNILDIIKDIFVPLNIPIILNVPFGHSYPNLTFPIGCYANYNKKYDTVMKYEAHLYDIERDKDILDSL